MADIGKINQAIITQQKTSFGITLAGDTKALQTKWLRTGNRAFDLAIGRGWPAGRIIEIFGEWSTGKSVLLLMAIREAQRAGWVTALYDSESCLERIFAKSLNVDIDSMLYNQPDSLEKTFRSIKNVIFRLH